MPFHNEARPSSLAIVPTVPSIPLYLGKAIPSPATAFFCSWSLTFAVSNGIVQICRRKLMAMNMNTLSERNWWSFVPERLKISVLMRNKINCVSYKVAKQKPLTQINCPLNFIASSYSDQNQYTEEQNWIILAQIQIEASKSSPETIKRKMNKGSEKSEYLRETSGESAAGESTGERNVGFGIAGYHCWRDVCNAGAEKEE